MKTMTCSMPHDAGSGNGPPMICARVGAIIGRSLHPSATLPAAVAAVVKKVRREMGDIATSLPCIVRTACMRRVLARCHSRVRAQFLFRHALECRGVATAVSLTGNLDER